MILSLFLMKIPLFSMDIEGYFTILPYLLPVEDIDEINGHPGKANQHLGVSVGKNCFVNV